MSSSANKARMNDGSYFISILLAAPALALGNAAAAQGSFISGVAMITSLVLAILIVLWTVRRLHDIGWSGWAAFLLLPPITLFFLIFLFIKPGQKEANKWGEKGDLTILGIHAKGLGRISGIVISSIFLIYLSLLYATFVFES